MIGDLLDAQRTLSQRTFERVRRIELQLGVEPSHYEPGADRDPASGSPTGSAPDREQPDRQDSAYERREAAGGTGEPPAVPTGNTYDKYGSTNPVVRRLMAGFERTLDELLRAGRAGLGRSTSAAARGC